MAALERMRRWIASGISPDAPRSYRGGSRSRVDADHNPPSKGVNQLAEESLDLLRRRVRAGVTDNPIIAGARNIIEANTCGPQGIQPIPATPFIDVNERIDDLWAQWSTGVDEDRSMSMRDMEALALGELFAVGEYSRHDVTIGAHRGFPLGPAIELIDAERLELGYTSNLFGSVARDVPDGNMVRQSVEFNAQRQRQAYHVLEQHPSDGGLFAGGSLSTRRQRIPADRMHLAFLPVRVNQLRGVPWPVAAMTAAREEQRYSDAATMLAIVASCFGIMFEGMGPPEHITEESRNQPLDMQGNPVRRIEPGIMMTVPPGATGKVIGPNITNPQMKEILSMLLRKIAAALRLSYSSLSRDYSRSTFSSNRAEQLEDRKTYRPLQVFLYRTLVVPFYRRCVRYWIRHEMLPLNGRAMQLYLDQPEHILACGIAAPGWDWVNPAQEAAASATSIRVGMSNHMIEAAERGRNAIKIIEGKYDLAMRENQMRIRRGIAPIDLDGMPLVSLGGMDEALGLQGQARPETPDDAADDGNDDESKQDEDTRSADDEEAVREGML